MPSLLTISQAASLLGVSSDAIRDLVDEAFVSPKTSRWKHKVHFLDLSRVTAKKRLIRIVPEALGLDGLIPPPPEKPDPPTQKQAAHRKVNSRTWSGKWPKAKVFKCSDCEAQAAQYHHEDYSLWWSVEPLCVKCHRRRHVGSYGSRPAQLLQS